MTAPLLRLADLVVGYSGAPAVRGLDLVVHEREIVALLGRNGAGKTTTINAICGLIEPISGRVEIEGRPMMRFGAGQAAALARDGVALVPEDRALFLDLTVGETLRLAGSTRRTDPAGVFDLFPRLAELRHRRVAMLSGGEQQMLSVARALARRPRLLLVDELSLGLAPMVVQQILTILRTIADAGCGVLLVEQHVHFALSVADRAYVLNNGQLALSGEAAALDDDSAALQEAYLGERA